jgi:general L-amino acid transport system permease protein
LNLSIRSTAVVWQRFSPSDPRVRSVAWQAAAVAATGALLATIVVQTVVNLQLRGIASGFDYLGREAGFEIATGLLSYSSRDTYARALEVGLFNTLRVCLLGILISTVLGLAIGLARLSRIRVVSALASGYVEALRNTPLLLQLLFWYSLSQALPGPHEALRPWPGAFLCFRGLFLPRLAWQAGQLHLERPELIGFGFRGGTSISPEFAALLIGLATYTAAFIAEIVRGGILAVDKGQTEAAAALGLSRGRTLRLVVFPQAVRLIVPPATSQFLNLTKNSSLAVAIGYPDLIAVTNTTLNQTGQAVEALALAMLVYLAISLVISLAMNRYNRAIQTREVRAASPVAAPAARPPALHRELSARGSEPAIAGRWVPDLGDGSLIPHPPVIPPVAGTVRRRPLFRDGTNAIVTAVLGLCGAYATVRFLRWAVVNAVWTLPPGMDSSICRAAADEGACWAVITERFRFIFFGVYPYGEQWRPALVCLLFVALYLVSARRAWWKLWLLGVWIAVPAAAGVLLRGGFAGLSDVPTDLWGGLPLTLGLSTVGFAAASVPGVALALGRRSKMPAIRALCVAYIELIRGVPLITFLFMAAMMFPLFMPEGFTVDKLLRAQMAFVLVVAAYLAEVIRAGLQAVPAGQYEAAKSMGLRYWPAMLLIVLPQAVRMTIPALVNTFIGFFKDTSLVAIIGLFDLLGAAKAVNADAKWIGFSVEIYIFVAAVYFVFCYAVSRYTQRLERFLRVGSRR